MIFSTSNLSPLASIMFGILILVIPRFLNYLIAFYLIIIGIIGLGLIQQQLINHPGIKQII